MPRGRLAKLLLAAGLAWVALAWGLAAAPAGAAGDEAAPAAPAETAQTIPLEPVYAPLTGPERAGTAQVVLTMQLVVGPDGDPARIRNLMPRFRDALIRDLFSYPLSQTGEFPEGMLPAITRRVTTIAERVYGKDAVSGLLFGQILKVGC